MREIVRLILITVYCLLSMLQKNIRPLAANPFNDVCSITEWVEQHPQQQKIMRDFFDLVESEPVAIVENIRKPVRVAIVYPGLQNSSYWHRNIIAFESRMKELAIPCETFKFFSKPNETALQLRHFRQALDKNPDYLICTLDSPADFNLIKKTLTKKHPKIILQNITTPLKVFGDNQPMLYTGFSHEIGSLSLADYVKQKFSNGINWAMIMFTDGHVSHHRANAFVSSFSEQPHCHLLEIYLAGSDKTKTSKAIEDAISRHPELNFVFACSTDVALNSVSAINSLDLSDQIKVNGWGGDEKELQAIQNGEMLVTVMRMNDQASIAIAEAIKLDVTGNSELIPTIFSGEFHIVDGETPAEELEQLKRKAFKYSSVEDSNND